MRTTKVTDVLASSGLHQRLYAEPTVVEEDCSVDGQFCLFDNDCCGGHLCGEGNFCYCYVC